MLRASEPGRHCTNDQPSGPTSGIRDGFFPAPSPTQEYSETLDMQFVLPHRCLPMGVKEGTIFGHAIRNRPKVLQNPLPSIHPIDKTPTPPNANIAVQRYGKLWSNGRVPPPGRNLDPKNDQIACTA